MSSTSYLIARGAMATMNPERQIPYYPGFSNMLGNPLAGMMLCHLMHWAHFAKDDDGWLWKTREDFSAELGLTRRQQETARKVLREARLIEERRRGSPARLFFRVDFEAVMDQYHGFISSRAETYQLEENDQDGGNVPSSGAESDQQEQNDGVQLGGNVPTRRAETYQPDGAKRTNAMARNVPTLLTEKTSKETAEAAAAAAGPPASVRVREDTDDIKRLRSTMRAVYRADIAMTPNLAETIERNIDEWCLAHPRTPPDWVRKAAAECAENNARNWNYFIAILDRWVGQGHTGGSLRNGKHSNNSPRGSDPPQEGFRRDDDGWRSPGAVRREQRAAAAGL